MYGLVLAGGGGKGGYHIGVWRALRKMKIKISAVTGTSIGSLNGALVAQNDYKSAVKLWSNISFDQVLNLDENAYHALLELNKKITPTGLVTAFKNSEEVLAKGGLDVTPLKSMITKYLNEKELRNSSIAYGLVTISLTDRKPLELFTEDIPEGKLVDYLLASSFLPGFMPMELDGKHFLDGGFYDNLPINLMLKKNVDKIIAVDLKSMGRKKNVKSTSIEVIQITPSGDIAKLLEF
ncbi:MAG: patatin-like phospholipase family protein, partial [Vallitaleaceae bacterium]|nr:patatin-like phospholipase family protein [Vallitaleaceae bacterium]